MVRTVGEGVAFKRILAAKVGHLQEMGENEKERRKVV